MIEANNRFLQRVNLEILRAKADGGEIYNNAHLQRAMRAIVDNDLYDNLKIWLSSELSKVTAGNVEKTYDLKGNADASQSNSFFRPEFDDGYKFDGSNDRLVIDNEPDAQLTDQISFVHWLKTTDNSTGFPPYVFGTLNDGSSTGVFSSVRLVEGASTYRPLFWIRGQNVGSRSGGPNEPINDGQWHYISWSFNRNTQIITCNIDGAPKTVAYRASGTASNFANYQYPLTLAARNLRGSIEGFLDCHMDDFMQFDKILTNDDNLAIYNATKDKYQ